MLQRVLLLASAARLALASQMGVTLVAGGTPQVLTPVPAMGSGQPFGEGAVIEEIPGFLSELGSLYWSTGGAVPGGSHFELSCPAGGCGTGWAKGDESTCFSNLAIPGLTIERWGWTNALPSDVSQVTMPIYTGAAHCDTSRGQGHTANAVFTFLGGGDVKVEIVPLPGVTISEYHLYVGSAVLPTKGGSYTVTPGQFPVKHTAEHTFTGLSGNLHAAIHVSTCGVASVGPTDTCDCTFYLVAYHCPPCSNPISGGWAGVLDGGEWEARTCGPLITKGGTPPQTTIAYKHSVPSGTTLTTYPSAYVSGYVGVFGVPCGSEEPFCPPSGGPPGQGPAVCLAHCSTFTQGILP